MALGNAHQCRNCTIRPFWQGNPDLVAGVCSVCGKKREMAPTTESVCNGCLWRELRRAARERRDADTNGGRPHAVAGL